METTHYGDNTNLYEVLSSVSVTHLPNLSSPAFVGHNTSRGSFGEFPLLSLANTQKLHLLFRSSWRPTLLRQPSFQCSPKPLMFLDCVVPDGVITESSNKNCHLSCFCLTILCRLPQLAEYPASWCRSRSSGSRGTYPSLRLLIGEIYLRICCKGCCE